MRLRAFACAHHFIFVHANQMQIDDGLREKSNIMYGACVAPLACVSFGTPYLFFYSFTHMGARSDVRVSGRSTHYTTTDAYGLIGCRGRFSRGVVRVRIEGAEGKKDEAGDVAE